MSDALRLERIVALRLVTRYPDQLARFYGEALGAEAGDAAAIGADECRLLGIGGGMRRPLRIGGFAIDLDRFDEPGRDYPADADAADLRFQHFAVVVRDIGAVFERACAAGATLISRQGPVTLPASSGGVTAIKLRPSVRAAAFPDGCGQRLAKRRSSCRRRARHRSQRDLGRRYRARPGFLRQRGSRRGKLHAQPRRDAGGARRPVAGLGRRRPDDAQDRDAAP